MPTLYEQLRTGVRVRGEFERSEELRKRADAVLERRHDLVRIEGKPAVVVTAQWPRPWVTYDADAGRITMQLRSLRKFVEIDKIFGQGAVSRSMYDFISTRYAFQRGGDYVGQNAFGVSTTVSQVHHGAMGIAWESGSLNRWNTDQPVVLQATPAEARSMVGDLGLRIVGELGPPYWIDYARRSEATLSAPTDARYTYKAVVADPRCLWIVRVSTGALLRLY